MPELSVRRTGETWGIASSEFEVEYPDGSVGRIWSPPWHELSEEEEGLEAVRVAAELYRLGDHLGASKVNADRIGEGLS